VWPGDTLPRTEGTQKLKRRELRQWVDGSTGNLRSQPASSTRNARAVIGRFVSDREVTNETTLAELGLSSIEKIELMMALEQELDRSVDEQAFANAATVGDLEALVKPLDLPEGSPQSLGSRTQTLEFPTWNRKWPARTVRQLSLAGFLLPLTRAFAWITVEGLDRLPAKTVPVIYAANHQSHMDGPVFLAALPVARRNRVATAAAKEFFAPHFHPERHSRRRRAASSILYYLASLLFGVFPLPQREAGAREAIRYVGDLIGEGASVLIFPEGRRTETGAIDRFQPGIGMIATRLHVPVVPVRLEGLDRILHSSWRMARPGPARVTFGEPLVLKGDDYSALAQQVEDAVRAL
jgi:long-chain acyl-CoA synthetase